VIIEGPARSQIGQYTALQGIFARKLAVSKRYCG